MAHRHQSAACKDILNSAADPTGGLPIPTYHQAAFDCALEAIVLTDDQGRYVDANPAACDLLGYTRHEFLQRHVTDVVAWSSEQLAQASEQFLRAGRFLTEMQLRRKDGSLVEVEIRSVANVLPGLHLSVWRDISERKRAESALRDGWERLRLALEGAGDYVWEYDAERNHFDFASVGEGILGFARDEVSFDPGWWNERVHPEDLPQAQKLWDAHLRGQTPLYECEHRLRHRSGAYCWGLVRGKVMERNAAGQAQRLIGITRDITERKHTEAAWQESQQKQRQREKLEALGLLASGIAHDFNNLLTVMLGQANLALLAAPLGTPAHHHLTEIEKAARRAGELTQQILAYSGKGRFVLTAIDLSALLQEMKPLLSQVVGPRARLHLELAPEPPRFQADATQMRQLVLNLVTHAAEALSQVSPREEGAALGRNIYVRTGYLDAQPADLTSPHVQHEPVPGLHVCLEVRDDGDGLSPETIARIFDPFFTTEFVSRGLGLAAVLGIVRGHQGIIQVASQLGRGSTFRVLFPATVTAQTPVDSRHAPVRPSPGTILVIDDEELIRSFVRLVLLQAGFTVLTAANGQEGLEVFRRHQQEITAVLLDLTMPHLGGQQLLPLLRQVRPDLVVLVMSGYAEQDVTPLFAQEPPAGFLYKPFSAGELLDLVQQAPSSR